MKKLLALVLAVVLALGCVSFAAADDEVPTLRVWVPDNLRVDWENSEMTKWLEEQGGFKLIIEAFPEEGYETQLNNTLTLNNNMNDWPDVILTKNFNLDNYVSEWGAIGAIIPLEEYYENPELTPNLQAAVARAGIEYYKQLTSPDGHIYMIGTLNQSFLNENPDKFFYDSAWLAALNLEVPTTTEEFYEVLKAIKGADLNGNGKDDEIGLAGTFGKSKSYSNWFNGLMNAFVYAGDPNFRTVNDGVVGVAYTTDEWKEGLKYIRKLFEEGLIASETLTMDNATYESLYGLDEQIEAFQIWFTPLGIAEEEILDYVGMAPLAGPEGVQYVTFRPSSPAGRMCITAACQNPEAAFKLGDLMSSEYIGISQRFGLEGVDWDYYENIQPELVVAEKKKKAEDPDSITDFDPSTLVSSVEGLPISIYTYHDGDFWGSSDVTLASWLQAGPFVRHYGIVSGWAREPGERDQGTIVNETALVYQNGGYKPAQVIPKTVLTDEENERVSEIAATLDAFVEEQTALFLSGAVDIDAGWDAFQAELKAIGVDEYVEVMQAMYDRMYK